jgi:hypothetical protein
MSDQPERVVIEDTGEVCDDECLVGTFRWTLSAEASASIARMSPERRQEHVPMLDIAVHNFLGCLASTTVLNDKGDEYYSPAVRAIIDALALAQSRIEALNALGPQGEGPTV